MSEHAISDISGEGAKPLDLPAGTPGSGSSRWTELGRRIRPIVEAFAVRLPTVRAAYLRRDGTDFIFAGDGWSVELSEAAAELSVALQRSFEPAFAVAIEGGYQPFRDGEIEEYETVFLRS